MSIHTLDGLILEAGQHAQALVEHFAKKPEDPDDHEAWNTWVYTGRGLAGNASLALFACFDLLSARFSPFRPMGTTSEPIHRRASASLDDLSSMLKGV